MNLADCRTLLSHDEWADALIWKSVLAFGQEDHELRAKLHHLHLVQWSYLSIWRGEQGAWRELSSFANLADMHVWARGYYSELALYLETLSEDQLSEQIRFPWADRLVGRFGKAQPASWVETVLQISLHSTHHRGQIAMRLRELGCESPLVDFIAWVWMGKPKAEWSKMP